MAKPSSYWEYDRQATMSCSACGWSGPGGIGESFEEFFEVRCQQCDRMLVLVSFPTLEETRVAAAAGNPRAEAELPSVNQRKAFLDRAEELKLRRPDQLPGLGGTDWRIEWDIEERDGEQWTVLRHNGAEIWRELAFWEGYGRFAEVFEVLRQRYEPGLTEVRPTEASKMYLYGDKLSAPETIDRLNAALRTAHPSL